MDELAKDWFQAYKDERAGLRESSLAIYGGWWQSYVRFLDELSLTPAQARPEQVEAFLQPYTRNTAIRYFGLLAEMYALALRLGLARSDPTALLAQAYRGEEEPVPSLSTTDVLPALYALPVGAAWKKRRDRALVLTSAELGLRRHELLELKLASLKLAAMSPVVVLHTRGQSLRLPVPRRLVLELEHWLEARKDAQIAEDLVFPADGTGRKLDPATVYRIIERALSKVGAGSEVVGMSGAQLLRATLAYEAQRNGESDEEVRRRLGHHHITSTQDLLKRLQTHQPKPKRPASAPSVKPPQRLP